MFNLLKKLTKNQRLIPAIYNDVRRLREDLSLALLVLEYQSNDVRDIKNLLFRDNVAKVDLRLETDFPIAYESADHLFPRGVARDNTRSASFVSASEALFQNRKIRVLDIGCAGGGMVFDFLNSGHLAVGIEGSDFAKNAALGHWGAIPNHLFTADATKDFIVSLDGTPLKFDLITAWEVLEHISDVDLSGFFNNVRKHLSPDGYFIASVCTDEDFNSDSGVAWHVTVHPKEWWVKAFTDNEMRVIPNPEEFAGKYPRGESNSSFLIVAQSKF